MGRLIICEVFELYLYVCIVLFDLFHILLSSDKLMDPWNVTNMYVCNKTRQLHMES
jgi:hypothetical protein